VSVGRVDPARVQGCATLGHVSVTQIGQSSAADAHAASSQYLAIAQVTGGDVHVGVVVMTANVMMRRRMQNSVLPRGSAARQGLQAPSPGRVTAQQGLHRFHRHFGFVIGQGTAAGRTLRQHLEK